MRQMSAYAGWWAMMVPTGGVFDGPQDKQATHGGPCVRRAWNRGHASIAHRARPRWNQLAHHVDVRLRRPVLRDPWLTSTKAGAANSAEPGVGCLRRGQCSEPPDRIRTPGRHLARSTRARLVRNASTRAATPSNLAASHAATELGLDLLHGTDEAAHRARRHRADQRGCSGPGATVARTEWRQAALALESTLSRCPVAGGRARARRPGCRLDGRAPGSWCGR